MSRKELVEYARMALSQIHMDRYGVDAVNMPYVESLTDDQLRAIITAAYGIEF